MREPAHTNNFLPQFLKDSGCVAWQEKGEGTVLEEYFLPVIQISQKQRGKLVSKRCLLKLSSQNQNKAKDSSIRASLYVCFTTSLLPSTGKPGT